MSVQRMEVQNPASDIRLLTDGELNEVNGALIFEGLFCIAVGVQLGLLWMMGEGAMKGGNVNMGEWLESTPPIL